MKRSKTSTSIAIVATVGLALAACGSDSGTDAADDDSSTESADSASGEDATAQSADSEVPTIVVTTNILGDVVEQLVGDSAQVVTIMPVGADPHDFQASAQEVDAMMSADALIVNGAAFEEGLLDVIENAEDEGVPTFEAISAVETIEFGEGGHDHDDEEHDDHDDEEHDEHDDDDEHSDDHDDEDKDEHSDDEHSDEEHSDDEHSDDEHSDDDHDDKDDEHSDDDHDEHEHSGDDPHFFTDPTQMAASVEGIVDFLQEQIDFADPSALDASAATYTDALRALDAEVDELLAAIPEDRRVLVTNHEVFGYFADRYEFEVVGAVIPGGGTTESVSPGELAELAEVIEDEGVPAIFADASSSDELVETLAGEVGDIAIVELYSESLGDADSDGATYLDMVRTNAERISGALA